MFPWSLQKDQPCPHLDFTPKGSLVRAATVISCRRETEPGGLGWKVLPQRETHKGRGRAMG